MFKKNFLILIILLIIFCSCEFPGCSFYQIEKFPIEKYSVPDYEINIEELENVLKEADNREYDINSKMELIHLWMQGNIEYFAIEQKDWQTPVETFETKKGDCKDQSLLWSFLINKYLDVYTTLWAVKLSNGNLHMCANYKDYWYRLPVEEKDKCIFLGSYDYEEALIIAEYFK